MRSVTLSPSLSPMRSVTLSPMRSVMRSPMRSPMRVSVPSATRSATCAVRQSERKPSVGAVGTPGTSYIIDLGTHPKGSYCREATRCRSAGCPAAADPPDGDVAATRTSIQRPRAGPRPLTSVHPQYQQVALPPQRRHRAVVNPTPIPRRCTAPTLTALLRPCQPRPHPRAQIPARPTRLLCPSPPPGAHLLSDPLSHLLRRRAEHLAAHVLHDLLAGQTLRDHLKELER